MGCRACRQRLSVDPGDRAAEIVEHLNECTECATWVHEATRFERLLRASIAIAAPEGLVARILFRQALRHDRQAEVRNRMIAATVGCLLTLLLIVGGWTIFSARPSLADEVLHHIDQTPAALSSGSTSSEPIAAAVLRGIGAEATGDLGDVIFANACVFRDRLIAHIALKGRTAPVTVMIMPREPVGAPRHIWNADQKGVLVPYGRGSMAIVGAYTERLDLVEARIRAALTWRDIIETHSGTS